MEESRTGRPPDITQLLARLSDGESGALDELVPVLYDELRILARRHLRNEATGHTLQTTALTREPDWAVSGLFVDFETRCIAPCGVAAPRRSAAMARRRALRDHAHQVSRV